MKTSYTSKELMTLAVKELKRMCVANGEPIPKEYWCWTHDEKFSEWDLEKHEKCKFEQEGQWI